MSSRVSIAMIVRDEAQMVPGFLQAVDGLWDELIVVDTGSSDATPSLFAEAGAKVIHSPWRNDFSAARNVSLSHSTGDWVLVLDADERVSPPFIAEARAAFQRTDVGALQLCISNQLPYGHQRDAWLLRAWRNKQGISFRHVIREDASDGVRQMLATHALGVDRVETPVVHLGYVRDRSAAKDKKERDASLLRSCVSKDPSDLYSWLKLLEVARSWQDEVLWRETALGATDAVEQLGRSHLAQVPWGGELIALIAEGLFAPDSPAGLTFLDNWEPQLMHSASFALRRGFFREHQRRFDAAKRDYERCLSEDATQEDDALLWSPSTNLVAPNLGLARLSLAQNNVKAALHHGLEALRCGPRDPEALMAVASLTRHVEGQAAFDAWVSKHEALVPACPERDWAVGEALLAAGEAKRAVTYFRRGAGVPPNGPAGLRLAQALLASGQNEAAEQLAHQLLPLQPEAGLGVLLFDLAAGRNTSLDLEISPETADEALKQWVDALLMSQQRALLRKVRSRVNAVGTLFPWLPGYLQKKTA